MPQQYMSAICHRWLFIGRSAVFFETTYGLMQQSPSEIKEKLLRALDTEYNVVDMVTVVEIITVLERTPITKDALETTRLGKYINELRRKTKNELLAKRAKELVRRWRDMILPTPPQSQPGEVNGKSSPSPDPPVEAVPRTHAANKRLRQEDGEGDQEPAAKLARLNGASEAEAAGPKKRGRKKGSKNRSTLAKAAASLEMVEDKLVALARTPKVKTTQELLADLRSRSGEELPPTPSIENKASLANCVVDDEIDIIEVVKPKSLANNVCDTSSNNVVIEKERKSKKHKHSMEAVRSEEDSNSLPPPPSSSSHPPLPSSVEEILSRLPPLNLAEIDWSEDGDSAPPSPPPPPPISETDVERLHTEHCEGLNGNWETTDSHKTEFREWHEMLTIRSSSDSSEPPLIVLPYAVID